MRSATHAVCGELLISPESAIRHTQDQGVRYGCFGPSAAAELCRRQAVRGGHGGRTRRGDHPPADRVRCLRTTYWERSAVREPGGPEQIELSDVRWFRPAYTGVIGLTAHVRNRSTSRLVSFELELTITDPGYDPEILTDTLDVNLSAGAERQETHFFARPLLGRDPHNLFLMRAAFTDSATLAWRITQTIGEPQPSTAR
jgi:hypothetical protein